MQSSTTTIHLDLRVEGDSLSGKAVNGVGRREFQGWIGLLAAIDDLIGAATTESTPQEKRMSIETAPTTVIRPGDAHFDQARQAFNLCVDQRPELVARPVDERDVIELVRYASANGLRVAPQRTGHNAGPIDWERPALLLRTDAMQGVEIDAENRSARVNAGAMWMDLVDDASDMGLAALHGSARDIGIAGYSLGGGLGWLARKHGLQTNSVTAIELVTADGELVRADHQNEPELFWALRGGGGNFGVVTALEFDLYPLEQVYGGMLLFPIEQAAEVLHAWREWTAGLPDELTSAARILAVPDIPDAPEPLRGKSFAVIDGAFIGTEADGADVLAPLRALRPQVDTWSMVPPVALSYMHMDPDTPVPFASDTLGLEDLSAEALDDVIELAGPGTNSRLLMVEFRHLGGALARSAPHHGARATLEGAYLMFAGGLVMEPDGAAGIEAEAGAVKEVLAAHAGRDYLNFVESSYDMSRAFDAESWRRLQAVKADWDPDGLFLANHQI